jgi:4-hydroxy-tetrahydrodipicolinate reductase
MSRYGAILSKFGLGLTADQFAVAQLAATVTGHHGFEQSIRALATGLGWELDHTEVDPVTPAVEPAGDRGTGRIATAADKAGRDAEAVRVAVLCGTAHEVPRTRQTRRLAFPGLRPGAPVGPDAPD